MSSIRVERVCPVCEQSYQADPVRLRHGRQTTCSRKCSYELRASQRRVRRPRPPSGRAPAQPGVYLVCATCGRRFYRHRSRLKRAKYGAWFCTRACHYAGRGLGLTRRVVSKPYVLSEAGLAAQRENQRKLVAARVESGRYAHSSDTKARISDEISRAIAEGRFARVSKLEDRVAAVLDALGIRYQRQVLVYDQRARAVGCLDFVLDGGVALEVNGSFWHADPRSYPAGPTHYTQQRIASRFARKCQMLAAQHTPLAIVWEQDFERDPESAVRAALEGR